MFVRIALKVMAWCTLLWFLLCIPTLSWWPVETAADPPALTLPAYIKPVSRSLFVGQIQEAVYEINRHCPLAPRKRLILLGGSGSQGYEPKLLQGATAADEVLNLSVVQSNFTQIRQILGDLRICLGNAGMRESAFIIIPSLGSFASNEKRFEGPYTDYETEKLRSRLFAGSPGAVNSVLGRQWLPLVIEIWRPVILARKFIVSTMSHLPARFSPPNTIPPSPDQEFVLRLIAAEMSPADGSSGFGSEQTRELGRLITEIRADGSTVVIAEQPIQSWLRQRCPAFADAHRALQEMARGLSVPDIDLTASAADTEFHDGMHANSEGAKIWTDRLAQALIQLRKDDPVALGAVAHGDRSH